MHFRYSLAIVVTLSATALTQQAFAQMDHNMHGNMRGGSMSPAAAPTADLAGMDDATVKKVDVTKATVTLAHGALSNGMPAMTMTYRVKDPTWLEKMATGQKIRFAAESVDGGMTMVRFEPVK